MPGTQGLKEGLGLAAKTSGWERMERAPSNASVANRINMNGPNRGCFEACPERVRAGWVPMSPNTMPSARS